jgi:hypothetical protein
MIQGNKISVSITTTYHLKSQAEPTSQMSCISNIPQIVDNVQTNCNVTNQKQS